MPDNKDVNDVEIIEASRGDKVLPKEEKKPFFEHGSAIEDYENGALMLMERERFLIPIPIPCAKCRLSKDILTVERGILIHKKKEVRLSMIMDVELQQNIIQMIFKTYTLSVRLFGQGSVRVYAYSIYHGEEMKDAILKRAKRAGRNSKILLQ